MIKNPLLFSHDIIKKVVNTDDYVIDATLGNGHDTSFLAKLVGPQGNVYGFDIQKQAIESSRDKLTSDGLLPQVELVLDGHETMIQYIPKDKEISAVMFNLGYLPKGDKNIVTKAETTAEAIKQALSLIKKQGVVSIMVYYGHEGTNGEKEVVDQLVRDLSQKEFDTLSYQFVNQINNPPYLYLIKKK